jgi:mRNA interferase RelE/StbE
LTAVWRVQFDRRAARELRKLGATDRQRILTFLRDRVAISEDPRRIGKALAGEHEGLWRYRVGDYRIIVTIEDVTVTVLVLRIGHRRTIYR